MFIPTFFYDLVFYFLYFIQISAVVHYVIHYHWNNQIIWLAYFQPYSLSEITDFHTVYTENNIILCPQFIRYTNITFTSFLLFFQFIDPKVVFQLPYFFSMFLWASSILLQSVHSRINCCIPSSIPFVKDLSSTSSCHHFLWYRQ